MATIRERVKELQVAIRDGDLPPAVARGYLNTLTAMIGNCNEEIREAQVEYHLKLLVCLSEEKHANKAKIIAQTSPAYIRLQVAKDTKELVVAMSQSLKYMLRSQEEEMRMSR